MSSYSYDKRKLLDNVDTINTMLINREPFYGHLFSSLNREIKMEIPTACIAFHPDSNYLGLWINPKFWNEQLVGKTNSETNNYRMGVLKHEILHIVYKHIFRANEFSDKKLFNIAADIVINQQIINSHLIDDACTIDKFPDYKLKLNETTEYYYTILKKKKEENDKKKQEDKNQSDKNLDSFYNSPDDNFGHNKWSELNEEYKGVQDLIDAKLEAQLHDIANKLKNTDAWGNVPGFIRDYIDEMTRPKQASINWKQQLRKFATSSNKTYIKNTIRRPSKRYGTTPGTKIKHKQKLLVAIDTSGSVDIESLTKFFGEIHHIYKGGASVRIVECDTDIHAEYDYTGKMPSSITGRGGTDFNAPFIYANKYNPDAIIYFTDGYCTPPKVKMRTNKVMWIICKNGINVDSFKKQGYIGSVIKINN